MCYTPATEKLYQLSIPDYIHLYATPILPLLIHMLRISVIPWDYWSNASHGDLVICRIHHHGFKYPSWLLVESPLPFHAIYICIYNYICIYIEKDVHSFIPNLHLRIFLRLEVKSVWSALRMDRYAARAEELAASLDSEQWLGRRTRWLGWLGWLGDGSKDVRKAIGSTIHVIRNFKNGWYKSKQDIRLV